LWSIFIPKRFEERITVTARQETETTTPYSFYWEGLKYKNDKYSTRQCRLNAACPLLCNCLAVVFNHRHITNCTTQSTHFSLIL
jgi:hypothetical protein